MMTLDHLTRHVNRVRFLQTTLYLDSDRGEISVDVTRDGTFYIEGPLGRMKTDRVLTLLCERRITGMKLYHHDIDCDEFIC
jgi:hypothetical protein